MVSEGWTCGHDDIYIYTLYTFIHMVCVCLKYIYVYIFKYGVCIYYGEKTYIYIHTYIHMVDRDMYIYTW